MLVLFLFICVNFASCRCGVAVEDAMLSMSIHSVQSEDERRKNRNFSKPRSTSFRFLSIKTRGVHAGRDKRIQHFGDESISIKWNPTKKIETNTKKSDAKMGKKARNEFSGR